MNDIILETAELVQSRYCTSNKGRCLDAANELCERLSRSGVQCAVQFGTFNQQKHAWLDIWTEDGIKLLDVTADQFGDYPPIIFGKMSDFPEYGWDEDKI